MRTRAVTFVVWRELRRRALRYLGLVLLVGLGIGASTGALVIAARTHGAYPHYVHSASVDGLVVNPGIPTVSMDRKLHHLPGVHAVHTDWLLAATVSITGPAPLAELLRSDRQLQVRGSADGRYLSVDRPVVTEGRFASGRREVFVSDDYRGVLNTVEHRHLEVGDQIDVAFWWGPIADVGLPIHQTVRPIGVEHLRIAGFGHLADEVLPDELYPRQRLIVSGDIAKRYSCLGELDASMSMDRALSAVFPRDCSSQYRYYSLDIDAGGRARAVVRRAFEADARQLSRSVPKPLAQQGIGYTYIAEDRSDIDRSVAHITGPVVSSFAVFGGVASLAVLTVAALLMARMLRAHESAQATLRALGATQAQRAWVAAGPSVVAVTAGLILALPVAAGMSTLGPVGAVRSVAPHRTWSLPATVVVPSLLCIGLLMLSIGALLGFRVARRAGRAARPLVHRRRVGARLTSSVPAPAGLGIEAATGAGRSEGAHAVLAGFAVGVAAVTAAVLFAANLTTLVHEPVEYGWPWDVAVITGFGYGDTNPTTVDATLRHDRAVQDYAILAFDSSASFGGRPVPTILGLPGAGPTPLPVVSGRLATRRTEVVLGAATARRLHVSVGDRVRVSSAAGRLTVRIVGTVVMPHLGPFLSERTGLGEGAFMPFAFERSSAALDRRPGTLVAIRLRPGSDATTFLAHIRPTLHTWDSTGAAPTVTDAGPVRPPAIVNADTMRIAPMALGGILSVGLILGTALSIGVSVRDRRRELATMRAIGFRPRDLRATVAWQAMTIVAVGLAVGMPLGVAAGRVAWQALAHQLGVVPRADVPLGALVGVAVGAAALGLLAAAGPTRAAARIAPNVALHDRAP